MAPVAGDGATPRPPGPVAIQPEPKRMLTSDYDFPLPERLIARYPPPGRADARMLVLHRAGQRLEHRTFADFPGYLHPDDLAVLNDTRVIPARVFANDGKTGVAGDRAR